MPSWPSRSVWRPPIPISGVNILRGLHVGFWGCFVESQVLVRVLTLLRTAVHPPQMTGCGQSVAYGPCDTRTWHPDLDWLQREFEGRSPPKLVYLVNPSNPSGDGLLILAPYSPPDVPAVLLLPLLVAPAAEGCEWVACRA